MRNVKEVMQDIIRQVYLDALNTCNELTPQNEQGKVEEEPNLEWIKFKRFLDVLPNPEDLELGLEEDLRNQFWPKIPGDSQIEKEAFLDSMLFSLWYYIEDLDLTFDLGDDGTDEAEMQKDMLIHMIMDILDPSVEVLASTYVAKSWIKEEFLDAGFPPMWIESGLKEELAGVVAEAPVYSTSVGLWLEKEMGYEKDSENCSVYRKVK